MNPAFFMSASAFHISGTIIQSCLTAIGPSGNHWFGPLARMKHSYTRPPSSTIASYFADARSSASVGGKSTFFWPVLAFLRLGFCRGAADAAAFFASFSAFFAARFASFAFMAGAGASSEGAGADANLPSAAARVTARCVVARRGAATGRAARGAITANIVARLCDRW